MRAQLPHEAAVEATFVNKDAAATLKLGQARGVAMLVPALAGLAVAEYAPNAVKKAVIGVGHGEKRQIAMMVKVLMPQGEVRQRGRRRRAGDRHLSRASPAKRRGEAGGDCRVMFLTCSGQAR